MQTIHHLRGALGFAGLIFVAACGSGGGNGGGLGGTDADTDDIGTAAGATSSEIEQVPVVGELSASCVETGLATIEGFIPLESLPVAPAGAPALEDVLLLADPGAIPVIGGLLPVSGLSGDTLAPISVTEVESFLPLGAVLPEVPVLGSLPISCDDLSLPDDPEIGELPVDLVPPDIVGLIPIVGDGGDVVGVIVATASNLPGGDPGITSAALPEPDALLPEELGTVLEPVLGLLGL